MSSKKKTKIKITIPIEKVDEKRAADIEKIRKLDSSKTGKTADIIVNGELLEEQPVYNIPRNLLKLNYRNDRFAMALGQLIQIRQNENVPNAADGWNMDDRRLPQETPIPKNWKDREADDLGGDVHQIRQLIKGEQPESTSRQTEYKTLKQTMLDHIEISKTNTNGQRDPAVITADGILVNGNRRDCVLEEFYQKAVADKTKSGKDVEKYLTMMVAICPPKITLTDIQEMEAWEQESKDDRASFPPIDRANLWHKIYKSHCLIQGLPLKDEETNDWQAAVISQIATKAKNRSKEYVRTNLNAFELANEVLELLGRKGELWRISETEKGVTSKVSEYVTKTQAPLYGNASDEEKELLIKQTAAMLQAAWAQEQQIGAEEEEEGEELNEGDLLNSYTFQFMGRTSKKVMGTSSETFNDEYFEDWDFEDSEYAKKFDEDLEKAVEDKKDEGKIKEPSRLLNDSRRKIAKIVKAMGKSSISGKQMLQEIANNEGAKTISDMSKELTEIKKKLPKPETKGKATKRKATKRKATKRKATKRKATKRKATKRKAPKRKATKRKATKKRRR